MMKTDLKAALTKDRLVDITTTGRQTGTPRRIEIGLHPRDGSAPKLPVPAPKARANLKFTSSLLLAKGAHLHALDCPAL